MTEMMHHVLKRSMINCSKFPRMTDDPCNYEQALFFLWFLYYLLSRFTSLRYNFHLFSIPVDIYAINWLEICECEEVQSAMHTIVNTLFA